jgi:tetratricopeptide (TPR) repeat protein
LWAISDFVAMAEVAQVATHLAQRCQSTELEAAGRYQWGRALSNLADRQNALRQLEDARGLAQTAEMRWVEGDAVRLLGNTYFGLNRIAESAACFEEALAIHREVGDRRGELGALNNLALITPRQGLPHAKGRAYLEQALLICREIGDRFAEGVVTFNLAVNSERQGDYDTAKAYYAESLAVRREIGAREGEGETLTYLGELDRDQGDYARASAHFEQAQRLFQVMEDPVREGRAIRGMADVQLDLGIFDNAEILFQRALALLRGTTDEGRIAALEGLSRLFRLAQEHEKACDYGRRAVSLAQEAVDQHREANAMTVLANALLRSGRLVEAADVYQQVLDMRREMGELNLVMEPLAGLAQIALTRNNLDQAIEHVEEILSHLEIGTLDGTEEPLQVYLTCYHALHANQDSRAQDVLTEGYNLLCTRASTIDDENMRRSYLENVTIHQEIMHEFENSLTMD